MKLKNKLEVEETLEVGVLPNAPANNFSVIFETVGMFQRRQVGNIINKNDTDFLPSVSNSFPTSVFAFNVSTTNANPNLTVSFVNQVAGTVFAAPQSLNGTPAFRMLQDSDLSQTSLGSKANANGNNLTNIQDWQSNLGIGDLTALTTTHKTDLVVAINEVNGKTSALENFGGRNYLQEINTYFYALYYQGDYSQGILTSTRVSSTVATYVIATTGLNNGNFLKGLFTFSGYVKINGVIPSAINISGTLNSQGGSTIFKSYDPVTGFLVATHNFTNTAWFTHSNFFTGYINQGDVLTIENAKFEKGSVPTDWTPAPEDQVSDWNEIDDTKFSFIKNKPTIPNAPNNGLLTISTSSDLTGGGTFSADQATASNVNVGLSAGTLASLTLANTAVQPSALSGYVPTSRTLTAGNGLSGGGNLTANRTFTLGTPSAIGLTTTNSVTSTSHTHALDASTTTVINNGQTAYNWGNHSTQDYYKYVRVLSAGEDLDNILINGSYGISSSQYASILNKPVTILQTAILKVFSTSNYSTQEYNVTGGTYTGRIFRRTSPDNGANWTSWIEIISTNNLDSQVTSLGFIKSSSLSGYLPLAGGTMTGIINTTSSNALAYNGDVRLSLNANNTLIGGSHNALGGIYFKPQGVSSTVNQVIINNSGIIQTQNYGDSSLWQHRIYNANGSDQYLGGNYISGGQQKPDYFGGGKLKLQMLRGDNIGATVNGTTTSQWFDALWLSSYTGGDVPGSNVLVFGKQGATIGFARQDFDSLNWGTYNEIIHTGNLSTFVTSANNGQLTLSTGTGLSGSATFTANQSGNSSFSVGIASTHKLPTTAEWNALSTQTLGNSTSNLIVSNTVQRAALTGDVTAAQNSNATTIANSAVTHAKYQNIATQRILGRATAGTGNVEELTATQVKTVLGIPDVIGNGSFTVQGTGYLTGSGSTSANASANTSASLDLTNTAKNDIQKGVAANAVIENYFAAVDRYFFNHDVQTHGTTVDTYFNIHTFVTTTGVGSGTVDIVPHELDGAELVIQGNVIGLTRFYLDWMDPAGNVFDYIDLESGSQRFFWIKDLSLWKIV